MHAAPLGTVAPQLEAVLMKGAGTVIAPSGTAAEVLFLMESTWVAEVEPTLTDPKASEVGESVSAIAEVPVPVRAAENWELEALVVAMTLTAAALTAAMTSCYCRKRRRTRAAAAMNRDYATASCARLWAAWTWPRRASLASS